MVAPGSTYADGQPIEWIASPEANPLAEITPEDLTKRVRGLAGAALMARYWADLEGDRHNVLLALAGSMVHAGWDHERVAQVLWGVVNVGRDPEKNDRKKAILDTVAKYQAGQPVSGLPTLTQYLPADIVDCLVQWWQLGQSNGNLTHNGSPASEPALVVRCMADVTPKPVAWLWKGRIAKGRPTVIAGDPGLGKSLVTANLAAHITTGRPWPVDAAPCERGSVIILSAEDDPEDTIRPRLDAAGADVSQVHIIEAVTDSTGRMRGFSLEQDLATAGRATGEPTGLPGGVY